MDLEQDKMGYRRDYEKVTQQIESLEAELIAMQAIADRLARLKRVQAEYAILSGITETQVTFPNDVSDVDRTENADRDEGDILPRLNGSPSPRESGRAQLIRQVLREANGEPLSITQIASELSRKGIKTSYNSIYKLINRNPTFVRIERGLYGLNEKP